MSIQSGTGSTADSTPEPLFEVAQPMSTDSVFGSWLQERFLRELVDEEIDRHYEWTQYRVAGLYRDPFQALFVFPEGERVFVGMDDTARDSNGLFGFVIDDNDRLPAIRTIDEALDLLKPSEVQFAERDGSKTIRQGEWFLIQTAEKPTGTVYSGEVSERPFGPSPLENHVPTEWLIGVPDEEFMATFREMCPELKDHVQTPADVFHRVCQAYQIAEIEDVELETDVPTPDEVREIAEPIFVRGTLRHRDNDHYMESIGEDWHIAVTHDVDVLTANTADLRETTSTRRLRYD